MKTYKHVFFDLDHTLWDFEKNCEETLRDLYPMFGLASIKDLTLNALVEKYKEINSKMWKLYNAGQITKEHIRNHRFSETFAALGLDVNSVPEGINDAFITICPTKSNVLPNTYEILEYLKPKYILHIITNGFKDSQTIKMASANLTGYFSEVIHSEMCGYLKPNRQIFDFALSRTNAMSEESIMIGDDLDADILGARNAGIEPVYFNPKKNSHKEILRHEISDLSELKQIL